MVNQEELRNCVESKSQVIDNVVDSIIKPYSVDLDNYVVFIRDCLNHGENPPTNAELEDYCMNLSTYIYFASTMCERIGIREDISRALWKEVYNEKRKNLEGGTVADKDSLAHKSN